MKKIILALVVGVIIGAIPSVFAIAKLFSDVDQNQWYADAVYSLTEKGVIEKPNAAKIARHLKSQFTA